MNGIDCFVKLKLALFVYELPMTLLSTSLNVANVPCSFSRCSVDKTDKQTCTSYHKYTILCIIN